MDINIVKQELQDMGEINPNIVCIARIGSSLIIEDPKDLDYIVIVKNLSKDYLRFRYDNEGIMDDYFIYNEDFFKSLLNNMTITKENRNNLHFLSVILPSLIKEEHVLYGTFDYKLDFIGRSEEMKKLIKDYFLINLPQFFKSQTVLPKISYWPMLMLKFLNNKSTVITDDIKGMVSAVKNNEENMMYLLDWVKRDLGLEDTDIWHT
jgi:hypothetical protein